MSTMTEGKEQLIQTWIQQLAENDESVRENAVQSLVSTGTAAVPYLVSALQDKDRWYYSAETLSKMGESAAAELVNLLGDASIDSFVYSALCKMGNAAVPALVQALGTNDGAKKYWAADALGAIGDMRAVPALRSLLSDPDLKVRRNAAEALSKLGSNTAL